MFRRQLRRNIRLKLRELGFAWQVEDAVGVFLIQVPAGASKDDVDQAVQGLRDVFGIVWISAAKRLPAYRFRGGNRLRDFADLQQHVLELARRQYHPDKSFCVRVNRGNKQLPFTSTQLAADLGRAICREVGWKFVDLENPDITIRLDLRNIGTFLFEEKVRGAGGLPVGTSGRVLALLSGGIDSPVAAYLLAKRGCRIDFIHFAAEHMTREEAMRSKIWRLARHLSRYTFSAQVYFVPYVHFDLALLRQKTQYEVILFRRFMARVAERLARRLKARAIVSGDNLSQVASQTLSNLVSTSQSISLPVLRPLIAFDKEETIALAEKIGTYRISIEAYKDCCALINARPKTRSRHDKLTRLEELVFPDYDALIEKTLAEALCLEIAAPSEGTQSAQLPVMV